MERDSNGRQYTIEQKLLLRRFEDILKDMRRTDLEPLQVDLVIEAHQSIVEDCFDAGLVEEICGIRDHQLTTYVRKSKKK